jgi:hypothetical protein
MLHDTAKIAIHYKSVQICTEYFDISSLRKPKHPHNALDDAKGNAEAFLQIATDFGLKIQPRMMEY